MAVQASYHQGDPRFQGNGRQCLANSAAAIRFMYNVTPHKWDTATLNQILDDGDKLYTEVSSHISAEYLTIENIPQDVGFLSLSLHGTLKSCQTNEPFYRFEDAINTLTVDKSHCGCLFTMGSANPSYSMAILKSEGYFVFDPHSRNDMGMVCADGFATMTFHKSVHAVSLFIKHMAASLKLEGDVPFEVARLNTIDMISDTESEFSGFDCVSEGEYTCKLFLADNVEVSSESELSDVYSSNISDVLSVISGLNTSTESIIDSTMNNLDNSEIYLNNINIDLLAEELDNSDPPNCAAKGYRDGNIIDFRKCSSPLLPVSEDDSYDGDDDENDKDYIPNDDDDDDDDSGGDVDDDDDEIPLSRLRNKINHKNYTEIRVNQNGDNGDKADSETQNLVGSSGDNRDILIDEDEVTPKRGRGRKRVRNESQWRRNVAKRRRNEGKSYVSTTGKVRQARIMKAGCGSRCRYKCKEKYSHADRVTIFHKFWQLGNVDKQREFVGKYTIRKGKKIKFSDSSRRTYSIKWTLPSLSNSHISEQVCKTFFLHTLSMSDRMVNTVHSKGDEIGICANDLRGRHATRPNRTSESKIAFVRSHIESYKCVHSHYCRKDSEKCYLDAGLNVTKMHKDYTQKCQENSVEAVSIKVYRHIFDNEYNVAFHAPLKDQCDFCFAFKHMPKDDQIQKLDQYREHLHSKDRARVHKSKDKEKATIEKDGDFVACCFDLEEVFLTPNSFNSSLYFKRRLNSFNLTVYEYGTKDGFCYIWNEAIGARGGCEIASCVYDYIQRKAKEGKKIFVFYTDNCICQNKNRYYVSMLWYCIEKFNLTSVEHKYLVKGHTQNEADSIHAGIEASVKNIPIFTTGQWASIIRTTRSAQPYNVKEMGVHDFLDFKLLSTQIKNFETNTDNEKVYWNSLRIIQLTSEEPNTFSYQTQYDGQIKKVDLFKRLRAKEIPSPSEIQLQLLRNDAIPISREKYTDLIYLCKSYVIPEVHHLFYLLLPHD